MQVFAEKENEREFVKKILKNHGIDFIITDSVIKNLFKDLEIQIKNKYN